MRARKIIALLCAVSMSAGMLAPSLAWADEGAAEAGIIESTEITVAAETEQPAAEQPPAVETVTQSETVTTAPDNFPDIMQILTDKQTMWVGDAVTYTIIGLGNARVLHVYDPVADPMLQTPLDDAINNPIFWNEEMQGWQFIYTPAQFGQFQLIWRLMGDVTPENFKDYTEKDDHDVITTYVKPTIQYQSLVPSAPVGGEITMVVTTNDTVDSVAIQDENGAQVPYLESAKSENMGSYLRWTCVFRYYEPGSYRVKAVAYSSVGGSEIKAETSAYTVGVTPMATGAPTAPLNTPAPGETPLPTEDPDNTAGPEETKANTSGYVRFKQVPSADAKVGETITLNLDVEFAGYDGSRINYTDPEFYDYVDYVEIQPEIAADPYPFVVGESLERIIIHSYEEMQATPFSFSPTVKKSLANGTYTFNFTLRYRLKGDTDPEADKSEAGMVFVTGAASSSGSGGGGSSGGGSGGVSTPTQAKLIVDSVTTDPADPQAGDSFDLVLTLKNTNEKQYVQNIKLTYTTDNDVLLPTDGSTSAYIDKINAGETYELRLPVSARADMPDAPVKLNISMDYEDKRVTSLSASQVVVLNVKQVQKLKLDELVVPNGDIYVGQSATLSMNIINAGRTTLYNVSAAMVPSDMYATAGSAYVGNMETGTSKNVELDIYPNAEGQIDGTLRVTYEDANGNETYADTPFSFYAMTEVIDDPGMYEPVIEPTPEPTLEVSNVLENLPWWVYGAAGMFVICIVTLIAIAAHRKKVNSFMDYDDE